MMDTRVKLSSRLGHKFNSGLTNLASIDANTITISLWLRDC